MKKLYYRLYQRGKAEDGQSMLEFVLVLPVFMLLLALVLDFGWLFYTQLGVENSARNAARIACVEYTRVAYDQSAKRPDVEYSPTGTATSFNKTYDLSQYNDYLTDENVSVEDENCPLTDQEKRILYQVKSSVPSNFTDVKVTIAYSYDKEFLTDPSVAEYKVSNRSNGDVSVLVTGTHHAISPLVNWDAEPGQSRMTRTLKCKSVYKVEANSIAEQPTVGH